MGLVLRVIVCFFRFVGAFLCCALGCVLFCFVFYVFAEDDFIVLPRRRTAVFLVCAWFTLLVVCGVVSGHVFSCFLPPPPR